MSDSQSVSALLHRRRCGVHNNTMSDYVSVQQGVFRADWELQGQFRKACIDGDLSEMEALIARGADPHDGNKETALKYACWYGVLVLLYINSQSFSQSQMCIFCLNSRLSIFC